MFFICYQLLINRCHHTTLKKGYRKLWTNQPLEKAYKSAKNGFSCFLVFPGKIKFPANSRYSRVSGHPMYCDVTDNVHVRPYVPEKLRLQVLSNIHCLSHPGVRAKRKMVARRFVWPSINRDVARYVRSCIIER